MRRIIRPTDSGAEPDLRPSYRQRGLGVVRQDAILPESQTIFTRASETLAAGDARRRGLHGMSSGNAVPIEAGLCFYHGATPKGYMPYPNRAPSPRPSFT